MKVRLSAMCWLAFCAALFAQGGTGTLAGKLTDQNGAPATAVRLSVEAKNTATGAVYKAAVSSQSDYTLTQLPPGTYDISVPTAFGAFTEAVYVPYAQKGVAVQAGQTLRLDITMKLQGNLATLGDNPSAMNAGMRARAGIPPGPTPRMGDGKPDLSGVWLNESKVEPPLPLQPWAEAVRKERQESQHRPKVLCLPSSPIQILQDLPYQLVQGRSMMVMLEDYDFPGWRQIFLDGRAHPDAQHWNPAWLGHSTGTWEGDTLVVDTVGYNDQGWLLGAAPNTEKLHVVERMHRPDLGHLEVDITAEDPGALTGVWKGKLRATLGGKDEQVLEYLCENNAGILQHMVGK